MAIQNNENTSESATSDLKVRAMIKTITLMAMILSKTLKVLNLYFKS